MDLKYHIENLEIILKKLSTYESSGLDTSSLRLFLKNIKTFQKIQSSSSDNQIKKISFEDKLEIIKAFLEDKKVFPRIMDVIDFANEDIMLEFKDQKESRELTISRIIKRIEKNPELKDLVKIAVVKIRNEKVHLSEGKRSKKDIDKVASYTKWVEILKNL